MTWDVITSSTCNLPAETLKNYSNGSPEPIKKYPRGIINPNYPGFQHLAHTLAEHFIDVHQYDHQSSSDSDFSEIDSDGNGNISDENNIITIDNDLHYNINNNNNIINVTNCINNNYKQLNGMDDSMELMNDTVSDDTNRYLLDEDLLSDTNLLLPNIDYDDEKMLTSERNGCDVRHSKTPDILMKSIPLEHQAHCIYETHQPDILKNVNNSKSSKKLQIDGELVNVNKIGNVEIDDRDDHLQWGQSPGDIIGDFEQEVAREFGLRVCGYKELPGAYDQRNGDIDWNVERIDDGCYASNTNFDGDTTVAKNDEYIVKKMCDAVLSNAKETIKFSSALDQIEQSGTIDELQFSEIKSDINCYPHKQQTNRRDLPTAIVKPKNYYKKSTSYDDRILPTTLNGIDYNTKSWFESNINDTGPQKAKGYMKLNNPNVNNLINNNLNNNPNDTVSALHITRHCSSSAKILRLPNFDRKSSAACKMDNNNLQPPPQYPADGDKVNKPSAMVQPNKKIVDNCSDINLATDQFMKSSEISSVGNLAGNSGCNKIANNYNNNHVRNSLIKDSKKHSKKSESASFDVYNIETALPTIDIEAIENHLKAAKEAELRKRTDREEIRRRLALGGEDDYYSRFGTDRPARKPSLHSRLQNGMNLQICFMNESASDGESPSSDSETCPKLSKASTFYSGTASSMKSNPYHARPLSISVNGKRSTSVIEQGRPNNLQISSQLSYDDSKEIDFFTKQARLQIEARMALAQAKDMAKMQMEMMRQKRIESPITEIIKNSIEMVGLTMPTGKRRFSRQLLTDMNIAQLQVIVNELHTQIERLNENLVQFLMERDDLHMSQDSMLVDIEDLTRYLGAKEQQLANEYNSTDKLKKGPSQDVSYSTKNLNVSNKPSVNSPQLKAVTKNDSQKKLFMGWQR